MKPRILGIDYGQRRVGIALSDPLGVTAQPYTTVTVSSDDEIIAWLVSHREELGFERIVLGLPIAMSGAAGTMADHVGALATKIENDVGVPVETVDERLSSAEAHRVYADMGGRLKGNKEKIDAIAAALILRRWMDQSPLFAGDESDAIDDWDDDEEE